MTKRCAYRLTTSSRGKSKTFPVSAHSGSVSFTNQGARSCGVLSVIGSSPGIASARMRGAKRAGVEQHDPDRRRSRSRPRRCAPGPRARPSRPSRAPNRRGTCRRRAGGDEDRPARIGDAQQRIERAAAARQLAVTFTAMTWSQTFGLDMAERRDRRRGCRHCRSGCRACPSARRSPRLAGRARRNP